MKSVVAAAALVAVAVAQSNPLIPSGISDGCTQFLNKLNTDTSMSTCLQSITTATSAFGPKANGTASATDVNSALSQLCSSTSCDDSTLRSQLAGFYSACQAELVTSPNAQVLTQYDSLYSLAPMKDALCIKQNGQYCVQTLNNASAPASSRKRAESQVVIVPSASTYAQKNIAFLQLSASSPQSILCSDCSKAIQQSWISSMNAAAYAPGLPNSQLLSGWSGLYNGTLQTCGASFLDTSTNNAGNGALNSGVFGASSAAVPEAAAASSVLGMLGALAFAVFAL